MLYFQHVSEDWWPFGGFWWDQHNRRQQLGTIDCPSKSTEEESLKSEVNHHIVLTLFWTIFFFNNSPPHWLLILSFMIRCWKDPEGSFAPSWNGMNGISVASIVELQSLARIHSSSVIPCTSLFWRGRTSFSRSSGLLT